MIPLLESSAVVPTAPESKKKVYEFSNQIKINLLLNLYLPVSSSLLFVTNLKQNNIGR